MKNKNIILLFMLSFMMVIEPLRASDDGLDFDCDPSCCEDIGNCVSFLCRAISVNCCAAITSCLYNVNNNSDGDVSESSSNTNGNCCCRNRRKRTPAQKYVRSQGVLPTLSNSVQSNIERNVYTSVGATSLPTVQEVKNDQVILSSKIGASKDDGCM